MSVVWSSSAFKNPQSPQPTPARRFSVWYDKLDSCHPHSPVNQARKLLRKRVVVVVPFSQNYQRSSPAPACNDGAFCYSVSLFQNDRDYTAHWFSAWPDFLKCGFPFFSWRKFSQKKNLAWQLNRYWFPPNNGDATREAGESRPLGNVLGRQKRKKGSLLMLLWLSLWVCRNFEGAQVTSRAQSWTWGSTCRVNSVGVTLRNSPSPSLPSDLPDAHRFLVVLASRLGEGNIIVSISHVCWCRILHEESARRD